MPNKAFWFLTSGELDLHDGPMPAKEIQAEAVRRGISLSSLRRAKAELGIKAFKSPGLDGCWMWWFPPREPTSAIPYAPPDTYTREEVEDALRGAGWIESEGRWRWPAAPEYGFFGRGTHYTLAQALRIAALNYRREEAERKQREWKLWAAKRRRRGANVW
jgi:hypothetical protein